MIRNRDEMPRPEKLEIDLSGPNGNVFVLMGIAKKLARHIYDNKHPNLTESEAEGLDMLDELTDGAVKIDTNLGDYITKKMMESDYDHALEVFEEYFGDFVILWK